MRIEHVALWTDDIDTIADFYTRYFGAEKSARYTNTDKGFESCFLAFGDGARLEIMRTCTLDPVGAEPGAERMGLTHLAISVGSRESVDTLTARLRGDGHRVVSEPRCTGDGYYESVVLDPDGNRVEITV